MTNCQLLFDVITTNRARDASIGMKEKLIWKAFQSSVSFIHTPHIHHATHLSSLNFPFPPFPSKPALNGVELSVEEGGSESF